MGKSYDSYLDWKIFEILFYRCRKFLKLRVQNVFTTRIQKWKSTGGMCFYERQYLIININCLFGHVGVRS